MEIINLTSKEIETFLSHFDLIELNQIKNLLNLGYYNLGNMYQDILKIYNKVEEKKVLDDTDTKEDLKSKIESLNSKELIFLGKILDMASFSNISEIDEYIESKDIDNVFDNTEYIPSDKGRIFIEKVLTQVLDKRKIKGIEEW